MCNDDIINEWLEYGDVARNHANQSADIIGRQLTDMTHNYIGSRTIE